MYHRKEADKVIVAKKGTIEAARGARGWTQKELARECGVSAARICAIESNGAALTPKTAKKICDTVQKRFEDLFVTVPKDTD